MQCRHTEICDFQSPIIGQEDIFEFQIAVTDASLVTKLESVHELLEVIKHDMFWKVALIHKSFEELPTAAVLKNEDDGIRTMDDVQ